MKNNIIAITGMTGVGKDFLVHRANQSPQMVTLNLGTVIGDLLHTDRDKMMREVNPQLMHETQLKAYRAVVKTQPLIVTCHAIRPNADGHYVYDLAMEQILNPKAYVFIWAPPEVIAERVRKRNQNGVRQSEEMPIQEIARLQETELKKLEELTEILGCELVVLNNIQAHFVDNITQLKALFQRIRQETAKHANR